MVIKDIKKISIIIFILIIVSTVFGGVVITGTKANLISSNNIKTTTTSGQVSDNNNNNYNPKEAIQYGNCEVVIQCPNNEKKAFTGYLNNGCPIIKCVNSFTSINNSNQVNNGQTNNNINVNFLERSDGIHIYFNINDNR